MSVQKFLSKRHCVYGTIYRKTCLLYIVTYRVSGERYNHKLVTRKTMKNSGLKTFRQTEDASMQYRLLFFSAIGGCLPI